MARNKSAMKRKRQSEGARVANRAKKSMIRTFSKKATAAAQAGNPEAAQKYQKVAISLIDKAAKGSTLHSKTASRKKSRMAKQINKAQLKA